MDKKKILIVEDDEFIRDIYREALADQEYTVDTANDGEEGLAKAQIGGYGLILLDMMMPKMNGIDLLKGLKASPPKNPNGNIILLTNLAQSPAVTEAMELGAKNYLIKSDLTPDQFIQHVKTYLPS